jgi:hypothetical protein
MRKKDQPIAITRLQLLLSQTTGTNPFYRHSRFSKDEAFRRDCFLYIHGGHARDRRSPGLQHLLLDDWVIRRDWDCICHVFTGLYPSPQGSPVGAGPFDFGLVCARPVLGWTRLDPIPSLTAILDPTPTLAPSVTVTTTPIFWAPASTSTSYIWEETPKNLTRTRSNTIVATVIDGIVVLGGVTGCVMTAFCRCRCRRVNNEGTPDAERDIEMDLVGN